MPKYLIGDQITGLFGWRGIVVWECNNVVLIHYANGFIGPWKIK